MDNFDLRKFLAEGKLNEAMSAQDTEDIAGMVADEFTKESADEGEYLRYSVGRVEGTGFELDTEATDMSSEDLDMRGVGEGWGGNFSVEATEDGLEVRNAEKGGLVAMIDGAGNFKMLSADESRAEMGLEEAGGDAQLMPSDPIVGFSQVASEFRDKLENNPQIDKIADMIIAKMSAEDKEAFVQKFKGKDEKSIFKMAMAMLKGLDEAVIDRDSAAGKFVALLGNLAGLNLMALGGGVLGVFIGKVLLGVAIPVIPALISLVVSLIIRNVAGKLLGANDDYTGLTGLEENKEIKSNKMKKSELKEMIKAAMMAETSVLEAEKVEVEDDENVDVDVEKDVDVKVDDEESEVDVDIKASMPGESEDVEEVQALLMKAQEAAQAFGDEKLMDQIGNTITYFTRSHVAGNVSEMDDMDVNVNTTEMEAELGLEEAMSDDEIKDMARKQAFGKGLPEDLIEPAIDIIVDMTRGIEALGIDPQKELDDQDVSPEQLGKLMPLVKDMQEKLFALVDSYTDSQPKEKSHFEKRLDKMRTQQNESMFPMWNKIK